MVTRSEHDGDAEGPAPAEADDGLVDLGARPSIGAYLAEMWERREFALFVPLEDIRVQNIDTALGQLWQLLNPALTVAVYYVIFGLLLEVDRGVENYLAFLVIGVLLFNLSTRIALDSVRLIDRDEGLIRSVQFPRGLLPVSTVVLHTLAFLPAVAVLFGTLVATGEHPRVSWLWFPLVLVLLTAVHVGIAFVGARAGHAVRDLAQVLPHVFRILFYLSGVLFAVDSFVENQLALRLFSLNPLYGAISLARWSLMGQSAAVADLVGLVAWSLVLPVAGLVYFLRAEHRYGE